MILINAVSIVAFSVSPPFIYNIQCKYYNIINETNYQLIDCIFTLYIACKDIETHISLLVLVLLLFYLLGRTKY